MKAVPMSVELIDHMGNDLSVVDAARVSFAKQSSSVDFDRSPTLFDEMEKKYKDHSRWPAYTEYLKQITGDEATVLDFEDFKLIHYLAAHNHWTTFGHATVKFRIKAPIFVARQMVKHQVGLVWNEVSRRYVSDEPEFWLPEAHEWRLAAANVKQGSSDKLHEDGDSINKYVEGICNDAIGMYQELLENNIAPEMARMVLPQHMMTEWIWTGSLYAWARVCKLRLDPHAQKEAQDVAKGISEPMKKLFPVAWKALLGDLV